MRVRRALSAIALMGALVACEPANETERLAMHVRACEAQGLAQTRVAACSLVIDAPNASLAQKVQALVQRGMLRATQSEDQRALADFGQALLLDTQSAAAHIQRGLLHEKHGAFGPAAVDFAAADQIDDRSEGAEYLASVITAQATAYRSQIPQLSQRIAANPKVAALYNDRCWLRGVVGEALDSALEDCNRALELAPNSAEMLDSRGLVNLKRGDYQAALADYTAASAQEPERGHFLYGRGVARYGLGMREEAQADWRAADALEPGIAAVYESYGVRLRDDDGF